LAGFLKHKHFDLKSKFLEQYAFCNQFFRQKFLRVIFLRENFFDAKNIGGKYGFYRKKVLA